MDEVRSPKLVREIIDGIAYEYYPLGKYIVAAPGVCGGRPTFKHTRLEVSTILALIAEGRSLDEVVAEYEASRLTIDAVREALQLADEAFVDRAQAIYPIAM
ncbi:MAG TPA: DUF433 domain-containing protein [Promineifilum sp.]|nr:DUF433 domain-containing protein [Promineifilum sp.]